MPPLAPGKVTPVFSDHRSTGSFAEENGCVIWVSVETELTISHVEAEMPTPDILQFSLEFLGGLSGLAT